MRKFLSVFAFALFVSVPALADTTINIDPNGNVQIQKAGFAAEGAGTVSAVDVFVGPEHVYNRKSGILVRESLHGNGAGSLLNAAGCPILFAQKYPDLPCPAQ